MPDVQPLIQQLSDPLKARAAFKAISEMGAAAAEPLLAALNDPNETIRRQVVSLLGSTKDPRAVAPLMKLTGDLPKQVQSAAIAALGNFPNNPRVSDFLSQLALRQGETDTRVSAIFTLGRAAGKDAAQALWLEMLNDPSPQMVINAASQLATAKQPATVKPLLATLQRMGEGSTTFTFLVRALGDLGDKRAFEVLVGYLNVSEPHKRAAVVHALGRLGDVRGLDVLETLKGDKAVAGQEDHGGPQYTVGDMAQQAITAIRKANNMPEAKPRWKFW